MIVKLLLYSIVLLLIGIFSTATSSIGIQCANDTNYHIDKPKNKTFLIVNLVSAILAFIGMVLAFY